MLANIEAELCLTDEKGDKINPKLASIVNSLFTNKLTDDKIKERLKRQLIPDNCSSIIVAKCNPEIWGNLPQAKKLHDISLQKNLNVINKAAAALANIGSNLIKSKASGNAPLPVNDMLSMATDAIALLGHASQELHQIRRENIKSNLPVQLKSLTYNIPKESNLLFGDDLTKRLQTLKATNAAFVGHKLQRKQWQHGKSMWYKNTAPKSKYPHQRSPAFGKRGTYKKQDKFQQLQQ